MPALSLRREALALRTAVVIVLVIAGGCRPAHLPPEAVRDLERPERKLRRKAASVIADVARDWGVLPPDIVDALLRRLSLETDRATRHAILMALVETGDPRVEPLLHHYMQTNDYDEQRARAPLYRTYVVKTGRQPAGACFPRNWPYGTPGFPPLANSGVVWIEDAPAPPKFTLKAETGVTVRDLYGSRVLAFDIDNGFGARTRSGIWGVRTGLFLGESEGGLQVIQFRLGPFWEAPTEYVRPMLLPRFTLLDVSRHTVLGPRLRSVGIGLHAGIAVDLWRHPLDHSAYVSLIGGFDAAPDSYILPGATLAFGGRY